MIVLIADTPSHPDLRATLAGCNGKKNNELSLTGLRTDNVDNLTHFYNRICNLYGPE